MAIATYYFNASDAGPTDPNNVWTGDANAFDGNIDTLAHVETIGSPSLNFLQGDGTNAPTIGTEILSVKVRAYTGFYWGDYQTLTIPTGGWTWQKVRNLEIKLYLTIVPSVSARVFTDGLGEVLGTTSLSGFDMARVEIEVASRPQAFHNYGRYIVVGDGLSRNEGAR